MTQVPTPTYIHCSVLQAVQGAIAKSTHLSTQLL